MLNTAEDYRRNQRERNNRFYKNNIKLQICQCGKTYKYASNAVIVKHENTKRHIAKIIIQNK
jgi:hypothetical protein